MLYSRKSLASGFCPGIQTLPLLPFNTGACMLYATLVLWVLAGGLGRADLFEICRSLSVKILLVVVVLRGAISYLAMNIFEVVFSLPLSPPSLSISNWFLFQYRSSSEQRSLDGSKEKAAPVCRLVSFRKHFLNIALVSARSLVPVQDVSILRLVAAWSAEQSVVVRYDRLMPGSVGMVGSIHIYIATNIPWSSLSLSFFAPSLFPIDFSSYIAPLRSSVV